MKVEGLNTSKVSEVKSNNKSSKQSNEILFNEEILSLLNNISYPNPGSKICDLQNTNLHNQVDKQILLKNNSANMNIDNYHLYINQDNQSNEEVKDLVENIINLKNIPKENVFLNNMHSIEDKAKENIMNIITSKLGDLENETLDVNNIEEIKDDINKINYKESSKLSDLYNIELKKINIKHNDDISVLNDMSTNSLGDENYYEFSDENDMFKADFNLTKNDISNKQVDNKNIRYTTFSTDEIIKTIKIMKQDNISEMNISLRPKELGDIVISLIKENNDLKAIINISKDETFDMINKNIAEIKQSLQNINVSKISVVLNENSFLSQENFKERFEEGKNNSKKNKKYKLNENDNEVISTFVNNDLDSSLNILA